MTRLQLRIYIDPGEVEVFCNLLRKDGSQEKLTAIIDTGAAVSLFPRELLDVVEYRIIEGKEIVLDQAGIGKQAFQASEVYITISLEDSNGQLTKPFEIKAWFADTDIRLIGFAGILDRAVLHIDMPQRNGWLDIDV